MEIFDIAIEHDRTQGVTSNYLFKCFDVRTKTLRRFVSNVEAFLKRLFKAASIQISGAYA